MNTLLIFTAVSCGLAFVTNAIVGNYTLALAMLALMVANLGLVK